MPNESPLINISDQNKKTSHQLVVKLQKPYDLLKNVTMVIKNNTSYKEVPIGETNLPILLPYNSSYTIHIPNEIEMSKNEFKGVFLKWSDGYNSNIRNITMDENIELYALFKPQYYLNVTSDVGKPTGSRWYDSNSKAEFYINPLSGLFLLKSFDHWSKDHPASTDINIPSGFVNMDGPKAIHAVWEYDFAFLGLLSGAIATSLTIAGVIRTVWRKITIRKHQLIKCMHCSSFNHSTSKHFNQCGTKLGIP
jgi:hypothetical protein